MASIKLYFLTLVLFLVIDALWLGIFAKNLYKEELGFLMTPNIRWGAAVIFYLLFAGGLLFFAILPAIDAANWKIALLNGAIFGLMCYATYDLTNLATLKDWPVKIVIYDILWGSFISGITSLAIYTRSS